MEERERLHTAYGKTGGGNRKDQKSQAGLKSGARARRKKTEKKKKPV